MPKIFTTKIGPRDLEILTELDRTPLTPAQLCRLRATFTAPFQDKHNLHHQLRQLTGDHRETQLFLGSRIRYVPIVLCRHGDSPVLL